MPRYTAERLLLAPLDDVWDFLAEPYNLADWWPGIAGVEPDRHGLAAGARWKVVGPTQPGYFRRRQAMGTLVVLEVVPRNRIAFNLAADRIDADLTIHAEDERRTKASLVVDAPWLLGLRGSLPSLALERLHSLLRTGEEI
jgi:uncharacterized protein YndB with AHSA1/START domain